MWCRNAYLKGDWRGDGGDEVSGGSEGEKGLEDEVMELGIHVPDESDQWDERDVRLETESSMLL